MVNCIEERKERDKGEMFFNYINELSPRWYFLSLTVVRLIDFFSIFYSRFN